MQLTVGLRWLAGSAEVDPRLIALLAAIEARGSLKQAIAAVGMSYRHAWERLGRLESVLDARLVELERGRGARLTALGKALVEHTRAIEAELRDALQGAARTLEPAASERAVAAARRLTVCASHDFALDRLAEQLPRRANVEVELRFQGSLDALASLARRRCDIAGFHVPALPGRAPLLEPFRPLLRQRALRLVHFADRRQGLIVARGNPLGIESLAHLTRRRVRFVNRQVGSGTRLMFDALLAAHGIRPSQIEGYRHEEFTHAAVAAMIAAGAADAGFSIEAAAAQHGLSFVALASERYFLALRESAAARPAARALLEALGSRWFRRIVRGLPGYTQPARFAAAPVTEALAPMKS